MCLCWATQVNHVETTGLQRGTLSQTTPDDKTDFCAQPKYSRELLKLLALRVTNDQSTLGKTPRGKFSLRKFSLRKHRQSSTRGDQSQSAKIPRGETHPSRVCTMSSNLGLQLQYAQPLDGVDARGVRCMLSRY